MSASENEVTITPAPNGPYLVKGLSSLRTSRGEEIETRPSIALCRCGASENKPFCDGTHGKIGFTGENAGGRAKDGRDDYRAAAITVHDNRGVCAHAGVCTDRLASVFRMKQEPWIDPEGAGAAEIIEIVRRCPSGALSYSVGGVEHRDLDRPPAITVQENGPYVVTGGPQLSGVECGEGASKEHFTLCRCGASKNKPFCDGSHWDADFRG